MNAQLNEKHQTARDRLTRWRNELAAAESTYRAALAPLEKATVEVERRTLAQRMVEELEAQRGPLQAESYLHGTGDKKLSALDHEISQARKAAELIFSETAGARAALSALQDRVGDASRKLTAIQGQHNALCYSVIEETAKGLVLRLEHSLAALNEYYDEAAVLTQLQAQFTRDHPGGPDVRQLPIYQSLISGMATGIRITGSGSAQAIETIKVRLAQELGL